MDGTLGDHSACMRGTCFHLLFITAVAHAEPVKLSSAEVRAVAAVGGELFTIGRDARHSKDGGATWTTSPLPIVERPHRVKAWPNAVWARSATELYAAGQDQHLWHSDGDKWTVVGEQSDAALFGISGNATLVLAVGEEGLALSSRDGKKWQKEKTNTRTNLRAVWVAADGHALAAGEDGALHERSSAGVWRRRVLRKDDILAQISDGSALWVLSTGGRLFRSADGGAHFDPARELPLGLRDSCSSLAAAKDGVLYAGCRAAEPHTEMVKEPPLHPTLLRSADSGKTWAREPVTDSGNTVVSTGGVVYLIGKGLWRVYP
jgi:photosystem II stability/assembly factor-like uncharacterized protein